MKKNILILLWTLILNGNGAFGLDDYKLWNVNVTGIEAQISDARIFEQTPTLDEIIDYSKAGSREYQAQNYNHFLVRYLIVTNKTKESIPLVWIPSPTRARTLNTFKIENNRLIKLERTPYRFNAFTLDAPPGRHLYVYYFHNLTVEAAGRFNFGHLESRKSFLSEVESSSLIHGAVFGIAFILSIYNLAMFLVFRKIYFLFYCFYTIGVGGIFAITSGYLYWESNIFFPISLSAIYFGLAFIIHSLELKKQAPLLYKMGLALAFLIMPIWLYCFYNKHSIHFLSLQGPFIIYPLIASIYRYTQGHHAALLYICGYLVFTIGSIISALNNYFFQIPLLGWFSLFGWIAEIAFFSFAIALKVRISEKTAVKKSLHAFDQLSKIVYPHQINQIKNNIPLEETMPIHQAEACVICFDIVGSSSIRHIQTRKFMEELFYQCGQVMSENYDSESLTSNAFRIKEMGDGFLCSVGYPFASPGENAANEAVYLCLRFWVTLQEASKILDSEHDILGDF